MTTSRASSSSTTRPGRLARRLARTWAAGRAAGRAQGFTLLELLIVVTLLTILAAALVLRAGSATDALRVDVAAGELASALRFARADALRTGSERGVRVERASGRVRVYAADLSGGSVALGALLLQPLDKRSYDFTLGALPGAAGVTVSNASDPFSFSGVGSSQPDVVFDLDGIPFFPSAGTRHPLSSGAVTLLAGSETRVVTLGPVGQVSAQ